MAKRAKTNRDDDDLISSLPDEIITQILSFIPTKSSVATSVLSKRWNHLWTSVPNLDFGKLTNRLDNRHHQQKFIDRVLTLNSVSCVRKIRLKYVGYLDFTRKNAWISSIANRDAEIININLPNYSLPGSFFNKQNLVKLKLANCCMQQLVSFPNLKTIHLTHIHFLDENSLKNLLFGCPGLKKLYIESAYHAARTFNICSSTLHVLNLCNSYGCKFVVDTPNLTNLHIEERFGESNYYNITNASSLVKLHLHLNKNDAMSHEHINMPIFQDLIHLTFIITKEEHWRECFSGLLHNTPNLVTLVLLSEYYVRCVWYDPNEVPHCLSRLENVEITIGFKLSRQEEMMMAMMISYILKNANVLKKLSIYTSGDTMWNKNKFVKTLLALPRSSDACQVCIF